MYCVLHALARSQVEAHMEFIDFSMYFGGVRAAKLGVGEGVLTATLGSYLFGSFFNVRVNCEKNPPHSQST